MITRLSISEKDSKIIDSLGGCADSEENDFFDYSSVVIDKPWGYEYSIFKNDNVDVWLLNIDRAARTSMHCHPNKETALVVLSGEVVVSTFEQSHRLGKGEGIVIEKGVFHSTQAISHAGALVIESETPINKKNLVRYDDIYGRRGKRYESGKFVKQRDFSEYPCFYHSEPGCVLEKSFGGCTLTLIRNADLASINAYACGLQEGIAIILDGRTHGLNGEDASSYGDMASIHQFKNIIPDDQLARIDLLIIFPSAVL